MRQAVHCLRGEEPGELPHRAELPLKPPSRTKCLMGAKFFARIRTVAVASVMLSMALAASAFTEPSAMPLSAKIDAKPKAVVHVGPHKMGSTSLQELVFLQSSILNEDSYQVPLHIGPTEEYVPKAGANIAECYRGSPPSDLDHNQSVVGERIGKPPCTVETKEAFDRFASETAARGSNLMLSSELFDTAYDTGGLASTLNAFDTTIAVSYRPLFDWMQSGAQLHLPFSQICP